MQTTKANLTRLKKTKKRRCQHCSWSKGLISSSTFDFLFGRLSTAQTEDLIPAFCERIHMVHQWPSSECLFTDQIWAANVPHIYNAHTIPHKHLILCGLMVCFLVIGRRWSVHVVSLERNEHIYRHITQTLFGHQNHSMSCDQIRIHSANTNISIASMVLSNHIWCSIPGAFPSLDDIWSHCCNTWSSSVVSKSGIQQEALKQYLLCHWSLICI